MPLPLLIPIAITIATAAGGGTCTVIGAKDYKRAREINNSANDIIKYAKERLETARKNCNQSLENLGKKKMTILNQSINRFIHSFEKLHNYEFIESSGLQELKNFAIDKYEFSQLADEVKFASSLAKGMLSGAFSGALAAFGAYSAVGTVGAVASTGTAIATLSGIAAKNATLAWLGGGALAAGGYGVVGGMLVLGGLVAGPAIAVTGFILMKKGAKALDEAKSNLAKAKVDSDKIGTMVTLCNGITNRANMFTSQLNQLDNFLIPLLNKMESTIKNSGVDYSLFTIEEKQDICKAYAITGAIKSILDVRVMDDNGNMTVESYQVSEKISKLISSNKLA